VDGFENLLKRNYGHHRRHNFTPGRTTHYRSGNRQGHLLSRANNLWAANDDSASAHFRQHLADSLINLIALYDIQLEGPMEFAAHRPNRQGDQVGIFFKRLLQTRVVTGVVQAADPAGNLKSAREAGNNVAISLSV
jgi:hypothetical protein